MGVLGEDEGVPRFCRPLCKELPAESRLEARGGRQDHAGTRGEALELRGAVHQLEVPLAGNGLQLIQGAEIDRLEKPERPAQGLLSPGALRRTHSPSSPTL